MSSIYATTETPLVLQNTRLKIKVKKSIKPTIFLISVRKVFFQHQRVRYHNSPKLRTAGFREPQSKPRLIAVLLEVAQKNSSISLEATDNSKASHVLISSMICTIHTMKHRRNSARMELQVLAYWRAARRATECRNQSDGPECKRANPVAVDNKLQSRFGYPTSSPARNLACQ